jgi:IS5 family transposase
LRLAQRTDWDFLERPLGGVYKPGPGQPLLSVRLMAGLMILKHMESLPGEVLCARFLDSLYGQFFCGEVSFRHDLPVDRSSLTPWRQRLGEEHLIALLQAGVAVAHHAAALAAKDLQRVSVDTTVQPKAVAYPTDAWLIHRVSIKLIDLAKRCGVRLSQSYQRVPKCAAIMIGRYVHSHQFKRANRELRFLQTRLGRAIQYVRRKIQDDAGLQERFGPMLTLAVRVRQQNHRQRGPKIYALHAPEVECIGKGKARTPYEFGCKVSIAPR